jgi:hypothetical protein
MEFYYSNDENIPIALSSKVWLLTARGLKNAADIIWQKWYSLSEIGKKKSEIEPSEIVNIYEERCTFFLIYMMLYGLALENLLKGIIISKNPSNYKNKIRWGKNKGHNLICLTNKISFKLTNDESKIINSLSEAIKWAGRYPVKQNHNNVSEFIMQLGLDRKGKKINNIWDYCKIYKNICDDLYKKIIDIYPNAK